MRPEGACRSESWSLGVGVPDGARRQGVDAIGLVVYFVISCSDDFQLVEAMWSRLYGLGEGSAV